MKTCRSAPVGKENREREDKAGLKSLRSGSAGKSSSLLVAGGCGSAQDGD